MVYSSLRLYGVAAAVGLAALLIRFIVKGYHHRKMMRNLPGPPHHWLWGHLLIMDEMQAACPFNTHPHSFPYHIAKKYNVKGPIMYLDIWPVFASLCIPLDPEVAQQFIVDTNTEKHASFSDILDILAGEGNLAGASGALWKQWRAIMNPGFAAGHLMTLVSGIVDDCLVFCDILSEQARTSKAVRMETLATKLTVDVIAKVVMDVTINSQRQDDELVDAFRDQVQRLPAFQYSFWSLMPNPYMHYKRWDNTRRMNKYIGRVLDARFATRTSEASATSREKKRRAIIDLALDSYLQDETESEKQSHVQVMDATFRKYATNQIKAFIFAGHDTTSSTIAYAYYLLGKNPECLKMIRDEHDRVLGSVADTPEAIRKNPHLLKQLEYTLAVTREVLRLFPAASSVRKGKPDFFLYDPKTGERFPTDNFQLWDVHYLFHHSASLWGSTAADFDPSRFLPANASKLVPNAWRAFGKGPRICIGQDLALLETKIILALTLRKFAFQAAYDRLEDVKDDGSVFARNASYGKGRQEAFGEEACQVLIATAKPREGMPMVITEL